MPRKYHPYAKQKNNWVLKCVMRVDELTFISPRRGREKKIDPDSVIVLIREGMRGIKMPKTEKNHIQG